MAVSYSDHQVWTKDKYFSKPTENSGDPSDISTNPHKNLSDYPCTERYVSGVEINKLGGFNPSTKSLTKEKQMSATLNKYPNVKYKGKTQEQSNAMLCRQQSNMHQIEKLNKSSIWAKPEDGEKSNRKADVKLQLKNPEFILSKFNDKQIDKQLNDTNSIRREWMTDTGMGIFHYSPEESTNVKMVIDSNASFMDRKDRFFTPDAQTAQEGALSSTKLREILERDEQRVLAELSSAPTRNKGHR